MATITDTPDHNATIQGTDDLDVILGLNFNDALFGGGGDDTVRGGEGNDLVEGNDGNDLLFGGDGNDTLVGGYGDDTLQGGAGRDWLTGGSGDDTFQFNRDTVSASTDNSDVITDFGHHDTASFDGFNTVTWDPATANFLSGQGHVIAHLEGL